MPFSARRHGAIFPVVMFYRGVGNCLQGGKGVLRTTLLLLLACSIAGCGTFTLGNVRPQTGKSPEQQQLDTLTCKDQANLAANSAGRQTGDFLLGLTIVGAPVAYEMDKAKQRQVFADCMKARGYVVTSPDGSGQEPPQSTIPISPVVAAQPISGADQLSLSLPPDFEMKPVTDALKSQGATLFAVNRTLEIGLLVIPVRHEGITDLNAFALTKRAGQADKLKDATFTDVSRLEVGGRNAARYRATGTYNTAKVTYVVTLIEGRDQIVIVSAWSGATIAQQQMPLLESLAGTVCGIL
jgi:hypothetical protein